mmetsp:Transcript_10209/g.33629  ORF Transcript_10209/g.33629 Transcript_10209/m.33629 type:complete len:1263 (-) Transcript_10209:2345-6133(-)
MKGSPCMQRCIFHCRVNIGQVVYMLACARLGIVYSCTPLEITDASLAFRVRNFSPTMAVVSGDEVACNRPRAHGIEARLRAVLTDQQPIHLIGPLNTDDEQAPYVAPCALSDSRPLCVVYTSGSTGKPKGVVHGHGGYASCVSRSMRYVFSASQADRFLAIGTFAWITGQSYMLTGPLMVGCTSVLIEGPALGTDGIRWARIVQMRGVSLLKVASAFVRHIKISKERSQAIADMNLNVSLRMATFCAEPVSHDVQRWACSTICPAFVNSYWATEHGSIVLTRSPEFNMETFRADTKCWPVPWVCAAPCVLDWSELAMSASDDNDSARNYLQNIILTRPYAGLARTLWGNVQHYHDEGWRGDLDSFTRSYFPRHTPACPEVSHEDSYLGFVQGDAGRLHQDGGWTFHGRSDEVLNVAGVRVGVGEIEEAMWMLQAVGNGLEIGVSELAVVGAPDEMKGEVPVIFATVAQNASCNCKLDFDSVAGFLLTGWCEIARREVGPHATPAAVLPIKNVLPKTVTGKITRALLRKALHGYSPSREVVERSTVNVAAYWECATAASLWRREIAQLPRVDLHVAAAWDLMKFDGHIIGGEPLLPAAGWLEILRSVFYQPHEAVLMTSVEFLKGARTLHVLDPSSLYARKQSKNQAAVLRCSDPSVFVRVTFASPSPLGRTYLNVNACDRRDILDEYDGTTHTRRCASLGLHYAGAFSCVQRVVWIGDNEARIEVLATSAAVLLDSGLQVLCSMDAVSRGMPFIPYTVRRFSVTDPQVMRWAFDVTTHIPSRWLAIVHVTSRRASTMTADVEYYRWEANMNDDCYAAIPTQQPITMLDGVSLSHSKATDSSYVEADTREHATLLPSDTLPKVPASSTPINSLREELLQISSEIVGGTLDPARSLFENGLHSLRAVELIGRVRSKYQINLSSRNMAVISSFQELTEAIHSQIYRSYTDISHGTGTQQERFLQVNRAALERILSTWHTRLEADGVGTPRSGRLASAFDEALRAASYMLRRGLFRYIHIQYKDGLVHFFMRPPVRVDLAAVAVISGTRVAFAQTDYNRHFTVREIIKDSERGFYNLLHLTGLAHLEHYYRVMFFASRLEGRFDHELLEGHRYYIVAQIVSIGGPLVDVDVTFFHAEKGTGAFVISWRLMLVVDTSEKRMYDFEIGAAVESETPQVLLDSNLRKRTAQRQGSRSVVVVLFIVASVLAFFMPWLLTPMCSFAGYALSAYASPAEALVMGSIAVLWIRVSINLLDTCDGPVDGLLPHG